jgi:predicted ATPase
MGKAGWYVITGGPSSGKTTLISKLSEMGYNVVPESARLLIDKRISEGKTLEEIRIDEKEFQKRVMEMKVNFESQLPKNELVFLDRGIPDTIAYFRLYGFDLEEILKFCQEKTYKKIFFLEQLTFEKDYARIEDWEKTEKLNKLLRSAYLDLGYEVVTVPKMPMEERIGFILSNL